MSSKPLPKYFVYSDEVKRALADHKPIVALESTIISHGLPYPQNKQVALELEEIVRSFGATPATIAIINGSVMIGLSPEDLQILAQPGGNVAKVSRRDIALVLSQKITGATTVSATALLAVKAGIHIFATGGIGGVHRGGHETMDISADLTELGRTPICVVSAGVKSILDIGRTLEYLETQGVTVVGYGTDDFPSFFTSTSGFKTPCRLDTAKECADMLYHNLELNLQSGIIVANPIPPEQAADGETTEACITTALKEADEKKLSGRDITPFLLKRVAELSEGKSLTANLALVKNNAKVASQIAVELCRIQTEAKASN